MKNRGNDNPKDLHSGTGTRNVGRPCYPEAGGNFVRSGDNERRTQ